jgi:membrane protein
VDLLRPVRTFDRYQQRHRWLAFPTAVLKKFGDDQGGSLAALVAYYAFFSLFPLLLVFMTILGFVLHGDQHAQEAVKNSVLGQFPVIGHQIQVHALSGRVSALVIGVVASILGGLGVTQAGQQALDRVWAVPFKDRPDFLRRRLRGLGLLAIIGLLFVISTAVSGVVTGGLGGIAGKIAGYALSLIVNFGLFLAAFRMMTAAAVPMRCLWVGVAVAAVAWEILQIAGGIYIKHVYQHMSAEYSQFGLVLALLVWLHLGAQMTLYAAELNVVLARKLWPRSLFSPAVPADERTLAALAKVEERHEREQVDVNFEPQKS